MPRRRSYIQEGDKVLLNMKGRHYVKERQKKKQEEPLGIEYLVGYVYGTNSSEAGVRWYCKATEQEREMTVRKDMLVRQS